MSDLLRLALTGSSRGSAVETDQDTGLPLVRLGRRVTADDVLFAQDDG